MRKCRLDLLLGSFSFFFLWVGLAVYWRFCSAYTPHQVIVIPAAHVLRQSMAATAVADSNLSGNSSWAVDPCQGKRVFLYELPHEFNAGVLERCDKMASWLSFCDHFVSHGFGRVVSDSDLDGDVRDWYASDPYMLEVIFHERMRRYSCLTRNPDRADAFFLPYYAGLDALSYLYGADYPRRYEQGLSLVAWLEENAGESWRRRLGRDHFMVTGRTAWDFASYGNKSTWGTGLRTIKALENVTTLVLERRPWVDQEQAIPYPTSFHPSSSSRLESWVRRARSSSRRFLMTLVGAPRPSQSSSIRGELFQQCQASASCNLVNCSSSLGGCAHNPVPIAQALLSSTFCLQPPGDTSTRRSTFDSLVCGCIPVFFHEHSAYTQYTWHLPTSTSDYSVLVPEEEVRAGLSLERWLFDRYPASRIRSMQETILNLIPRLVYVHPSFGQGIEDAFQATVAGMVRRARAMDSFQT